MPSFDIVSKVNDHEITNAIDQANRELDNRFDFKGSKAHFENGKEGITLVAPSDFQLQQMAEILNSKMAKRSIDVRSLDYKPATVNLSEARQLVVVRQGIDKELAKKITKIIKDSKLKVQAAIQGEQVRVTGVKRDELQQTIALLRKEELELPLQFENFRD